MKNVNVNVFPMALAVFHYFDKYLCLKNCCRLVNVQ